MNDAAPTGWTLDELAARAALALASGAEQPSGRVREVPDLRSIRYYTTLGLLDRPAAFRGRTALYGTRHLAQLVAIKRLQAQGQPLAQVQRTLASMDERELLHLAALPHDAKAETLHAPHPDAEPAPARAKDFWTARPSEIAPAAPSLKEEPGLQAVALDAKALLVLTGEKSLDPTDLEAIRAAAAPLVKLLKKRGLLGPHNPEEA
ncbi:MAG: MerR family transcriptional regulator [Deltaproteobacteria bacterium]|nr:MerR family transcriptional regulator [Deltaproteobacteria bacterium]